MDAESDSPDSSSNNDIIPRESRSIGIFWTTEVTGDSIETKNRRKGVNKRTPGDPANSLLSF